MFAYCHPGRLLADILSKYVVGAAEHSFGQSRVSSNEYHLEGINAVALSYTRPRNTRNAKYSCT